MIGIAGSAALGWLWLDAAAGLVVAAWLVWRETDWDGFTGPLALFVVQLVLNAAWSWLL